jgi:uncharacterized membrane protein
MPTKITRRAATLTIVVALLAFGILLLPAVFSLSPESERVVRLVGGVLALVLMLFLMFVEVFGRSR